MTMFTPGLPWCFAFPRDSIYNTLHSHPIMSTTARFVQVAPSPFDVAWAWWEVCGKSVGGRHLSHTSVVHRCGRNTIHICNTTSHFRGQRSTMQETVPGRSGRRTPYKCHMGLP